MIASSTTTDAISVSVSFLSSAVVASHARHASRPPSPRQGHRAAPPIFQRADQARPSCSISTEPSSTPSSSFSPRRATRSTSSTVRRRPTSEWLAGVGIPLRTMFGRYARDDAERESLIAAYREYQMPNHDRLVRALRRGRRHGARAPRPRPRARRRHQQVRSARAARAGLRRARAVHGHDRRLRFAAPDTSPIPNPYGWRCTDSPARPATPCSWETRCTTSWPETPRASRPWRHSGGRSVGTSSLPEIQAITPQRFPNSSGLFAGSGSLLRSSSSANSNL